jgi:RimJ/RimL family protein N-acetyltransferase
MSDIRFKLSKIKHGYKDKALESSLIVHNQEGNKVIAYLIPVGEWICSETDLLNDIAKWRNKFMRFYLTQFKADLDNARKYIRGKIESDPPSIFFIIADESLNYIGHIGFSNISTECAELDNVLLGRSTNVPYLMRLVETSCLNWAKDYLGISKIVLRVLSYNFLAINLHKECGFKIEQEVSIKKIFYPGYIKYEACDLDESDTLFSYLLMKRELVSTQL